MKAGGGGQAGIPPPPLRPQGPNPPSPGPSGTPEAVLYLSKACSSTKCIYKSLRMFFFYTKIDHYILL